MQIDINVTLRPMWEGIVRIDNTINDYVSDVQDQNDHKQINIEDVKYHHPTYHTFDNATGKIDFPTIITILVYGNDVKEYMKCTAFHGYQKIEKVKGLIRKEKFYEEVIRGKGFKLEPIVEIPSSNNFPILASYRAKIGADNTFDIKEKGIVAFGTGSESSDYDSAYSSITSVFIASNDQPFMAIARKKGEIFKVRCDSSGIKEQPANLNEKNTSHANRPKNDPLTVLKLRLAKGEITKEEYEDLTKTLEMD